MASLNYVHLYCQKTNAISRLGMKGETVRISFPRKVIKSRYLILELGKVYGFHIVPLSARRGADEETRMVDQKLANTITSIILFKRTFSIYRLLF